MGFVESTPQGRLATVLTEIYDVEIPAIVDRHIEGGGRRFWLC